MSSRQPVSTGVPCLSCTMTASRAKITVQAVSQSGPTSTRVWRKPGMRCTFIGNTVGRRRKFRFPVTVDFWV